MRSMDAPSYGNGQLIDPRESSAAAPSHLDVRNGAAQDGAEGEQDAGLSPSRWMFGRDLCISLFLTATAAAIPFVFAPSKSTLQDRATPYQVTANGDIILDFNLNKLVKPATIPNALLAVTGGIIPFFLVIIIGRCGPGRRDIVAGLAGLFTAFGLSEIVTQSLKLYVGRLRPNFYELCGWSMDDLKCNGDYRDVLESQLSFPSGHSSVSFCSCVYLLLYIVGKIGLVRYSMYTTSKRLSIITCGLFLIGWAAFVASSRVHDYWHHPSDVLTGSIIGTAAAIAAYHTMYPPVYSAYAGTPLALISAQKLPSSNE